MIKIKEVVIVEGNYDKSKLSGLVDATIVVTDGFMIYKDKKKCQLLKTLAKENGAIIFTDSDSAGFKIRNFLKNILKDCKVRHAYIPDIIGKEKRKNHSSKEGFLGVEGVDDAVILGAIEKAGYDCPDENPGKLITKTDLYSDGITGGEESSKRRDILKKELNLPSHLSTNMLLDVLNRLYGYEEYKKLVDRLFN